MAAPAQRGTALYVKAAPTFANFRVVSGTWKESDAVEHEIMKDEVDDDFNVTFSNDSARNASCDLVSEAAQNPIQKGDLLPETSGLLRVWVVVKADYSNFGSRALKASVDLIFRPKIQA